MRPFLPVISFVVVSFLLLAAWVNYSNPDFALRPLLYLVRMLAWLIALGKVVEGVLIVQVPTLPKEIVPGPSRLVKQNKPEQE